MCMTLLYIKITTSPTSFIHISNLERALINETAQAECEWKVKSTMHFKRKLQTRKIIMGKLQI